MNTEFMPSLYAGDSQCRNQSKPGLLRVLAWMLLGTVFFHAMELRAKLNRPNVLFIAVDDLNDWIGALGGHPEARTPNIDRLASKGLLFRNAHCAAPACNPSRVALMTGLRPSTTGVYLNSQPWRPVLPKAVTLSQHFMANGYRTIGGGKIYHGRYPDPASWQEYFPSQVQNKPNDPLPESRPINGIRGTAHFDWGPIQVNDEAMGDHKVADWVIDQLSRPQDKPFFLACGIYRPHLPWYVPQKYFDQYPVSEIKLPVHSDNDLDDIPPPGLKMAKPDGDHRKVLQNDQWEYAVQGYLASMQFADVQVGRVLSALEKSAHASRTLVVFWTDHGWHLGEKKHWRKFALWEEATRTPLIMYWPGMKSAGKTCDQPVNLVDLYPTLVDLCGLSKKDSLDGVSLKPLLDNPETQWQRPSLTTHGRGNHALRSRHWRYIQYQDGSEELYDHRVDSQEYENLADDPAFQEIKNRLSRWLPSSNAADAPRVKKN